MTKLALYLLALPKSLWFNLRYFPLPLAVRLPVLVSHKVLLRKLGGTVELPKNPKTAGVRIGFGDVQHFDRARSRAIWHVKGRVVFKGRAKLGHGCKIIVKRHAALTLGNRFNLSAESSLICSKAITFGDYNLVSWESQFMDSDLHDIYDEDGSVANPPKPIIFGDSVWTGCRVTVLKGSRLAPNSIVAAGSVVSGHYPEEKAIYAGNPAAAIKRGVTWDSAARDYH